MAARKNRTLQDDHIRQKIKTGLLIDRLQRNALGTLKLDPVQQRSCEILLRKAVPDLQAVQHKGDPENPIAVEHALRPQLTRDEWLKIYHPNTTHGYVADLVVSPNPGKIPIEG